MKNNRILHLSDLTTQATKPQSKAQYERDLAEINRSMNKGRNEAFKKFGVKKDIVECELTNEYGVFKAYYFKEVYELIKHLKQIKFVRNHKAISIQADRAEAWIKVANNTKRKLKCDISLCKDHMEII
jgi:hypothetical protein